MKRFVSEIAGSLIIFIVAAAVGLTHNAVRGNSLPLIQRINQAAAQSGNPGPAGSGDAVVDEVLREGTVSAGQLKQLIDARLVYVIDARSTGEYEEAHVPGSVNIPHDRLPEYMDQLLEQIPMDALVACYCQGPDCDFSDLLATELKIIGYPNVVLFPGGWEHWETAGYPAEGTKAGQ
jgi:rhodanese-related sulfurtransferase